MAPRAAAGRQAGRRTDGFDPAAHPRDPHGRFRSAAGVTVVARPSRSLRQAAAGRPHHGGPRRVEELRLDGTVGRVTWRDSLGRLHDPPDGTPALRQFADDGTVEVEGHYRRGRPHPPATSQIPGTRN